MSKGKRVSLHVGVNDWPGTDLDLRGCVNDARDWQALAQSRGYATSTLLDAQATRTAIMDGVSATLGEAGPNGRVLVTVSSHGTQVPVTMSEDEPDAMTEAICAYDYRSGGLVTDDDVYRIFATRPLGCRVLLVVDTCHSGTMNRASLDLPYPREEQAARYLPPAEVGTDGLQAAYERRKGAPLDRPVPVPLLAACAPDEVSWDTSFGGRPNGAFTYYAIKALSEEKPRTLRSWVKAVRGWLPSDRLPQTPRLDSTATQGLRRPLA